MLEIWQQFKQNYLIKYWNPVAAVIAAGLISAYYFGVTGTYWAVTGEFTRWGGHALQALGVNVSDWSYYKIIGLNGTVFSRIDGVMILGMFAGCISAALWANNVKWRNQPHKRRIVQPAFVDMVCQKLAPNGFIHMATDWENYAEQMLAVLKSAVNLRNVSPTDDYIPRPDFRPLTKFEARGHRLGHGVWDLYFIKRG